MVASMVRPFSRRRLLVEYLLDGARQELLLAAGLLELGRAELGAPRGPTRRPIRFRGMIPIKAAGVWPLDRDIADGPGAEGTLSPI
jgi:hypothetical protein